MRINEERKTEYDVSFIIFQGSAVSALRLYGADIDTYNKNPLFEKKSNFRHLLWLKG